ncbi:MAG: hypothetical protein KDA45_04060 [Planctomycetales bacterium]|nr:hypothetical protein [Planctomycetales bacterium]
MYFFLVDRGRPALERLADMRISWAVMVDKLRRRFPLTGYLLLASSVTLVAWLTLGWCAWQWGLSWPLALLLALPLWITASSLGIGVANWLATHLLSPQSLPRKEFKEGIPARHRTLVVVPTMLNSPAAIERLIDGLEVRYLANRDPSLHFALLTDLVDAATETLPGDAELVRLASVGIARLNAKYGATGQDLFYLFHRCRQWNKQQDAWMGYERKRGKLAALNATLRGATDRFDAVVGEVAILQEVQFVITLDTDTQLPRDAARLMVGTLAHPLNRPVFQQSQGRVTDGYTILQPRVSVDLTSAQRSRFALWFSGDAGVDPYTRVVSDVYQDLFGEGSFIGKGIYAVDAFERCCGDFPENAILSHDLLEGAFCRSALLSDVLLYEEHPSRYSGDIARRRLLEWKTFSDSEQGLGDSLGNTYAAMLAAPLSAAVILVCLLFHSGTPLAWAAVWLVWWCLAPLIAWWLSQPLAAPRVELTLPQHRFLEKLSRRTWRYFEEYVTAESQWLPPDNVQQNPLVVVAPRTSPTNIGMGLLSDLATYDFGYCSAAELVARTQRTLGTLGRMERYRGHFFNWYDTSNLEPLHPRYVSMVDSGNLAASLLVLCNGLQELTAARPLPPRLWGGLGDTLRVLLEVAQSVQGPRAKAEVLRKIEREIEELPQPLVSLRVCRA